MTGLSCRIVLKGEVSKRFEPAFEGLLLRHDAGYTELKGTLADRSQLQGLLNRLFDLGLQIVSVRADDGCTQPDHSSRPA